FPHPDDESSGPASVIHHQKKAGHEIFLLTLTKGGGTSQRLKHGHSIEEMGEIRHKEMVQMEKVLKLDGMTVLDFPDRELKEIDPRILEQAVKTHIQKLKPSIVITYPVHGISGFHDHLVTHAVVKRIFLEMKEKGAEYLKRLAFFTIPDNEQSVYQDYGFRIRQSEFEFIDCIYKLEEEDIEIMNRSLSCYETYQEKITPSGMVGNLGNQVYFEFFNEDFEPPVQEITESLPSF
ncbi:PIG-L family deacetylase, partial [Xanthovirga aplysinae]|uniref:PIG-L family deacetylase n=1 Tax=Xanthovirga aplysinae TaxID=2529853 RepID=UPI0012BC08FD